MLAKNNMALPNQTLDTLKLASVLKICISKNTWKFRPSLAKEMNIGKKCDKRA